MLSIEMLNFEQAMEYFESFVKMCRIDGQDESFYGGKANKLSGKNVTENKDDFLGFLSHNDNAAIDLTFSAPKSLSILIELTDDITLREKLIGMHDDAVRKTLGYMENNLIVTRVSEGNDPRGKRVNKLVPPNKGIEWAAFRHHASSENDPHLYTRALVANRIYVKGQEYSIDARDLYKYLIALGKMYRADLCNELRAADISITVTDYKNLFFTVEGISEEAIQIFSKQSKNMDKLLKELKKEFPDEPEARLKELANMESRPDQGRTETLEELRARWKKESPQKYITYIKKSVVLANTEDAIKAAVEAAERYEERYPLPSYIGGFSDLDFKNSVRHILIYKGYRFNEATIQAAFKEVIKKRLVKEIGKNLFISQRRRNGFDR